MADHKKKKKVAAKTKFFSFATLRKFFKIIAAFALVGLICCIPAYIVVFKILPAQDPDNQFNRETIMQVLSGETRVFYNDGDSLLGAFFDANHRLYLPYGDIPSGVVNALIAAEDANYWSHVGFDFSGFTRAMVSNLKNGKMRQGGSTLTQQTVKNIFGREERSIKEKWKELINALRMETHFSKEEILEFYLNQFHVSGTGKGVAIAAQYFFDKDLFNQKDPKNKLTLGECAFIAGSVKGPFNYDPFIQKNEERRQRALKRGQERLRYVLGRMVEQKYISQEEMDHELSKPLEFKHGDFRFTMSTILERVEERLNSDYFTEFFKSKDIDDWHKAQLTIVTTVDQKAQDAAKRALQANISNLQLQLGGYVFPKAQYMTKASKARKGDYLYGAVEKITTNAKGKISSITVSFGQLKGEINEAALKSFSTQTGSDADKVFAGNISTGTVILVSILDEKPVNGAVPCKIETEPVLQGGLLAIKDGQVIASQGGFHNTGYDRSFKALRQLGSSWKPLLYALALKYNWNYQDVLENDFNVFQFTNQFYYPRPDHKNKGDVVSIAWAATRSENIASIWLLEHLLDKISPEEFLAVAEENGYAQKPDEDQKAFFIRLRDKFGLTMNDNVRQEIEFSKAKEKLVDQYKSEGKDEAARTLQNLRFGTYNDLALKQAKKDPERTRYINHNFKRYSEILRAREIKELDPDVADTLQPINSVILFNNFTLADFKRLSITMEQVDKEKNYLDPDNIRYWPDYRRSLAMAEFARFAKEIGIQQKLQKVFSMPLGVNDIPLSDITTAYQTILTGKIYKCKSGGDVWTEPCLIKEIKDRNGNVLFTDEVESKIVLDENVTTQMAAMLHSVFVNGTARSQYNSIVVTAPDNGTTWRYPALGKTGTTNDYKNVAFLGAIPTYNKDLGGATTESVVAIGSYVGFDNNKPMKVGRTRISGAYGGLPQWAAFATEEIKVLDAPYQVDFLDLPSQLAKEVPLILKKQRGELMVDPMTGIAIADANSAERRPMPWLDVPGFIPPQVHEFAAESAAEIGIMTSMEMMAPAAPEPVAAPAAEEVAPATEQQPATEAGVPANDATAPAASATQPAEAAPVAAQPAPAAPAPAPKKVSSDDEWDLPADFDGKKMFVPIEAE
ncbi:MULTISPECIES: transglycosylase domain-containing protein [unclassified Fibrobacter]|uniref:transglycosylase domain-containing protein n=1 Tax=unclassified Fibrobacter TaxID=2634177 RepID=UPI000D6C597D|nr:MULTISPECIES: transglycosylase domain-containing protein [unclassified Fibrobacter]PWJ62285.1 transglycosylase [Fibrobacter sp. UWR4]PZW67977.1 transglycosylase [Fibrobacter sp. UWR1]